MKKLSKKQLIIIGVAVLAVLGIGIYGLHSWSASDSSLVFKGKRQNLIKQEEERKNTYVIGVTQLPTNQLTFLQTMEGSKIVNELVYPALAKYEKGNYTYELAESITFSENGKKAKITLRTDATFSDGCALTADDILYSYQFFNHSDTDYVEKERFLCIEGMEAYQNGKAKTIDGIEKLSEHELEIMFSEEAYENFRVFELPVIHSKSHELSEMDIRENYLGCGDYQIESHSVQQKLFLTKNPYAATARDYEAVELVPADIARLENQEIDTMVIPASTLEQIKEIGCYDIYREMTDERDFIVFNPENEAMSTASARKEIAAWLDTEKLVAENYDTGLCSKGILHGDKAEPNYLSADKNLYSRKTTSVVYQCSYMTEEMKIENAVAEQLENGEIKVEMYNVDESTAVMTEPEVGMYYYVGDIEDLLKVWSLDAFYKQTDGKGLSDIGNLLEQYLVDEMYAIPLHNEVYYKIHLSGRKIMDVWRDFY